MADDDEVVAAEVTEVFEINEDAMKMKQYLLELADSCEKKAGEGTREKMKTMGTEIIEFLREAFGEATNIEMIATITRVLLYMLDEAEKRSAGIAIPVQKELPGPDSIN